MRGRPFAKAHGRRAWSFGVAALLAAWAAGSAPAQNPPAESSAGGVTILAPTPAAPDNNILQAGCSSCGGGLIGGGLVSNGCGAGGCGSGRCDSCCYPGRPPCCSTCCDADTFAGRFFVCLYDCVCCPDPCYDPPTWLAVADAAFFTDAARPITQTRLRWDSAWDFRNPDRAEYLFARENTNPKQTVASCRTNIPGTGISCPLRSLDYEDLSLYTEGATGRVGVFVEIPYREVSISPAGFAAATCPCNLSQSGFADMNVGTKTLLIDCELMQMSFQFKTFIPTGSAGKGLGTNHVSLEPALLFALKISPVTYLQAETAYFIPLSGDPIYQANVFHAHASFNHVLWSREKKVQVIGTAEFNSWSIFGGAYTQDFRLNPLDTNVYGESATTTIASMGPGIRAVFCDRIDIGVGTAFAVTGRHWAQDTVRAELRWRY